MNQNVLEQRLKLFKRGTSPIIVTTAVLEEGIYIYNDIHIHYILVS